ncbi:hypothetical protein CAEBREN_26069 [Caenorhabditis brenneri]|uniref:Uncharacterized protein n=1 Tax=Caenorhabditis brenneri TaxID=135651 RepID=G0MZW4_CAEBE|nr:hypothetical protein CAEBREN_26069 [Caenorhabditis brenneri]
MIIRYQDVSF